MEKDYFVNLWLRQVLHLMRRPGFVRDAAAEGHLGRRVFNLNNPAKSINSVIQFVRMLVVWANDASHDNYVVFEEKWKALGKYTWEFARKYGDKIAENYKRK